MAFNKLNIEWDIHPSGFLRAEGVSADFNLRKGSLI
nr:MAG TPA_asm: hypothetical protein [Caudoviricetes sp.]DAO64017.1 MAG TPA: hypothetical protein [Bacteriophage sp.]DAU88385.1 MAG TPA: hypothetical protein [Caudoviricetes sp.]